MPSASIVGMQWGDEGKGKVLDALASEADVVIRYQGGGNAGHTVVVGETRYVFHLVPTGILYPHVTCVVGNGCVVDVTSLTQELEGLREQGIDLDRLKVSSRAHVVFPYHKALDEAREALLTWADKIGTTKRGIGPCYADKSSRVGIRIGDLYDADRFSERLRRVLDEKNAILTQLFRRPALEFGPIRDACLDAAKALEPYVTDTSDVALRALDAGKKVLYEGAQGIMLDVDHGTYPYVTSSHASSAGIPAGAGVPPRSVGRVLGISKAYTTRVGAGPFPSELHGEEGETLRKAGHEYGATTGRPRRCGWLDLPQLRYAARLLGTSGIVLTKLDTLAGLGPVKVVTAYEVDGERREIFPPDAAEERMTPVYEQLEEIPAGIDYAKVKSFDDLPDAAKAYVSFVEERLGVPIDFVSTGPQRSALIHRGTELFG